MYRPDLRMLLKTSFTIEIKDSFLVPVKTSEDIYN